MAEHRTEIKNNSLAIDDINSLFDEIVLTEEHLSSAAYQEGLKKGCEEGAHEGYQLGFVQGRKLGEELAGIYGTVVAVQHSKNHTDKVKRTLQQLRLAIETFPRFNKADFDLIGEVEKIRILHRKLDAMTTTNVGQKDNKKNLDKTVDYSF